MIEGGNTRRQRKVERKEMNTPPIVTLIKVHLMNGFYQVPDLRVFLGGGVVPFFVRLIVSR